MSVSLTENEQVVTVLLDYLNTLPGLPAPIRLEELEDAPAVMLQQLAGATKVRQNIVGGYTAQFPFALYVRVQGVDTASRIAATGVLNNIGRELERRSLAGELPPLAAGREVTKIELQSFPSMISANEDGSEDYQAVYMLEYTQKPIV